MYRARSSGYRSSIVLTWLCYPLARSLLRRGLLITRGLEGTHRHAHMNMSVIFQITYLPHSSNFDQLTERRFRATGHASESCFGHDWVALFLHDAAEDQLCASDSESGISTAARRKTCS